MMQYAIVCRDAEGTADARRRSIEEHRRYVDAHAAAIVVSGALLAEDSEVRVGQLFVLEVQDRAAATRFVAEDPLSAAGVFGEIEIWPMAMKFSAGVRLAPPSVPA